MRRRLARYQEEAAAKRSRRSAGTPRAVTPQRRLTRLRRALLRRKTPEGRARVQQQITQLEKEIECFV